jgi:hypothetical protein
LVICGFFIEIEAPRLRKSGAEPAVFLYTDDI